MHTGQKEHGLFLPLTKLSQTDALFGFEDVVWH